jgi:hypothetical protein
MIAGFELNCLCNMLILNLLTNDEYIMLFEGIFRLNDLNQFLK